MLGIEKASKRYRKASKKAKLLPQLIKNLKTEDNRKLEKRELEVRAAALSSQEDKTKLGGNSSKSPKPELKVKPAFTLARAKRFKDEKFDHKIENTGPGFEALLMGKKLDTQASPMKLDSAQKKSLGISAISESSESLSINFGTVEIETPDLETDMLTEGTAFSYRESIKTPVKAAELEANSPVPELFNEIADVDKLTSRIAGLLKEKTDYLVKAHPELFINQKADKSLRVDEAVAEGLKQYGEPVIFYSSSRDQSTDVLDSLPKIDDEQFISNQRVNDSTEIMQEQTPEISKAQKEFKATNFSSFSTQQRKSKIAKVDHMTSLPFAKYLSNDMRRDDALLKQQLKLQEAAPVIKNVAKYLGVI